MAYNVRTRFDINWNPRAGQPSRDASTRQISSLSIFEDPAQLEIFQRAANWGDGARPADGTQRVEVLSWTRDSTQAQFQNIALQDLLSLPAAAVRVVLAPFQFSPVGSQNADAMLWLINHYAIPSSFLSERIRSTTHSFGYMRDRGGYDCAWLHYLCRKITITRGTGEDITLDLGVEDPDSARRMADHSWIREGYFVRWPAGITLSDVPETNIELVCFGASQPLQRRLRELETPAACDDVSQDPFSLLACVLDQLVIQMDTTVWDLLDVFRPIEKKILDIDKNRESFTGLHNVSKHVTYLQESCEALLLTAQRIKSHHGSDHHVSATHAHTASMLSYIETQIQSVKLRLVSLEKRMTNVIQLSFHLVTQEGNSILHSDSSSMATISAVTLVFLPITTISTIFGSQFFNFGSESRKIEVSADFWIFWVISAPVTVLILVLWRWWSGRSVGKLFRWKWERREFTIPWL